MDRKYWEHIADSYDDEIFDVFQNDKKSLVLQAISDYSSKKKVVIDLGCAVGKWLPALSPRFQKVVAVDISAKNLSIAKKSHTNLRNVDYKRIDLSSPSIAIPKADVAVCINALLTPSLKNRTTFISNISKCLDKNGALIITVPSLESWMLSSSIQHQYNIDADVYKSMLSSKEGHALYKHMLQGNAPIDGVPTKHFLKEELQLLLSTSKFRILKIEKINYEWTTEFIDPPKWLKEPYPWDWMCVCEKL